MSKTFGMTGGGGGGIKLVSIAITTPPAKTAYTAGETFDPAGMVVKATYSNGATLIATGYVIEPSGALTDGTTSVAVRYTEGGVTKTAEQAITVTAPVVIGALNDCTWEQISEISSADQGANYWSIGDCKAETLNGTVGALTFNNETYYPFIVDFNHNQSVESTNAPTITFQFAKSALTGGADIAFVDGSYSTPGSSAAFRMNTTNTNSGGWTGSYMKKTIMPAFKSACSAALQTVVKPVTVYSDNVGGSDTASNVTASSEEFYLPAELEVRGSQKFANSAEQNYQTQLAYYKAGNSKVKYKHNATGTAADVWCRSAYRRNSTAFCNVGTSGSASGYDAYHSLAVAPLFNV